mmetsp:Transcript_25372/g.57157  ORF Transcript_25372/g.57157 Transcript_25372/m.57157 type:complete len:249 (-) Transcript_25372:379-1125(-)
MDPVVRVVAAQCPHNRTAGSTGVTEFRLLCLAEGDLIAGVVVTAVSVDINVDEDVGVRVAVVDLIPDGLVDLMRHSHVRESWPRVGSSSRRAEDFGLGLTILGDGSEATGNSLSICLDSVLTDTISTVGVSAGRQDGRQGEISSAGLRSDGVGRVAVEAEHQLISDELEALGEDVAIGDLIQVNVEWRPLLSEPDIQLPHLIHPLPHNRRVELRQRPVQRLLRRPALNVPHHRRVDLQLHSPGHRHSL